MIKYKITLSRKLKKRPRKGKKTLVDNWILIALSNAGLYFPYLKTSLDLDNNFLRYFFTRDRKIFSSVVLLEIFFIYCRKNVRKTKRWLQRTLREKNWKNEFCQSHDQSWFNILRASIRSLTSRWIHGKPTSKCQFQSCRSIQLLQHGVHLPSSTESNSSLSRIQVCHRRDQDEWRRNECSMVLHLRRGSFVFGTRQRECLECSIQQYIPCELWSNHLLSSRRIQLKPFMKNDRKKISSLHRTTFNKFRTYSSNQQSSNNEEFHGEFFSSL